MNSIWVMKINSLMPPRGNSSRPEKKDKLLNQKIFQLLYLCLFCFPSSSVLHLLYGTKLYNYILCFMNKYPMCIYRK